LLFDPFVSRFKNVPKMRRKLNKRPISGTEGKALVEKFRVEKLKSSEVEKLKSQSLSDGKTEPFNSSTVQPFSPPGV